MITYRCDGCKQDIPSEKYISCADCAHDDKIYHRTCLKKINGQFYCIEHQNDRTDEAIITGYAKKFWAEIGLTATWEPSQTYGVRHSLDGRILVDLFGNTLRINVRPVRDNNNQIIAVQHHVSGLSQRDRILEVGIHDHSAAKAKIVKDLINSLRSRKSAMTQEYKRKEAEVVNLRSELTSRLKVINEMLRKLGVNGNFKDPKLPSVESIFGQEVLNED